MNLCSTILQPDRLSHSQAFLLTPIAHLVKAAGSEVSPLWPHTGLSAVGLGALMAAKCKYPQGKHATAMAVTEDVAA